MILDRLLGRRTERLATKIAGRPLSEVPGAWLNTRSSSAGVSVTEEDAMSLSAVFAGVSLLSSIIGALPLSIYRKSNGRREVADDMYAQRVLHTEYNADMSASIGRRTSEFHRLLWGNEYTEITWLVSGKDIWSLDPIEPWRVQPKRRENGGLYYLIDGTREVDADSMLHVPLISSDGVCGASFVDYALNSLGVNIATQDFSARFFANGARPGGLLVHTGSPPEDKRKEFQRSWTEFHGGSDNAGKTGVLWGGWDYKDAGGSMELDKAQLLETKRFGVEEVARWLNIPPHLLRDLSRATFSNIEHQGIDFVIYSLMPPLTNKEQEIDRKILNPPELYCKHNVSALLRGDSAARAAFYKEMFMMGAYSQNMILDFEDQNPIPNGDFHYVPANMMTIERAIKPPEPAPSIAPAIQTDSEQDPTDPNEPIEPDVEEQNRAHRGLLVDVFARLGKKEINEVRRAAKKPDKLFDWMESFYGKFETTLADALKPALAACGIEGEEIAAHYCQASREELLRVSESLPADFPARIEELLTVWAKRPELEADLLLRSRHAEV